MTERNVFGVRSRRQKLNAALERSKDIKVTKKTFHSGHLKAKVLIAGKTYIVTEATLDLLAKGWTPDDLQLKEIRDK